jgi:hypothetical protein
MVEKVIYKVKQMETKHLNYGLHNYASNRVSHPLNPSRRVQHQCDGFSFMHTIHCKNVRKSYLLWFSPNMKHICVQYWGDESQQIIAQMYFFPCETFNIQCWYSCNLKFIRSLYEFVTTFTIPRAAADVIHPCCRNPHPCQHPTHCHENVKLRKSDLNLWR